ncbi:MAG: Ycf48-like protein [bacterium]|nr:Ycf48-like protein [bacterium]MCK6558081.1 YCF48-related protein [bacterium]NUM67703.1 T9SS type A sorting domain-containing protein [candidate division KSB1 bacterium]
MSRFINLVTFMGMLGLRAFAQESQSDLIAIVFYDNRLGWIASESGQVYSTEDRGMTWTERSRTNSYLRDLDFVNRNTGFAVTLRDLLHTADAGLSWNPVFEEFWHFCSLSSFVRITVFMNRIAFVNNSRCIIEPDLLHGAILLADTSDILATIQSVFDQEGGLFDLAVVGESRMWAVGTQIERVSRTLRGAVYSNSIASNAQWHLQYLDEELDRTLYAVGFVDSISGWACGDRGLILHTRDGENWRAQTTPLPRSLFDIAFVDSRVGWAVGNHGTILHTLDGGETWTMQISGASVDLNEIAALSADTACVVGNGSTILITVDGGLTWQPGSVRTLVALDVNFVPLQFMLHQNHPNPFNRSTAISFSLPRAGFVTLKIYNLLGRLVAVLFDREAAPGRYEVVWNGKDLRGHEVPSGIYIYRLQAGQVEVAKRMMLVR